MTHDESPLDSYLESAEKRARSARLLSIALTIVPVVAALLFLLITVRQVQKARAELATTESDLVEKRRELEETIKEKAKVEKQAEFLGETLQGVPPKIAEAAINKALRSNPRNVEAVPLVYVHIWNESQRAAAKEAGDRLQRKGYIVPGIEIVGNNAPDNTELRYFHNTQQDVDDVRDIARTLQGLGISVVSKKISSAGDARIRARRYELWFEKDHIEGIEVTRLSSKELKVNVRYSYDPTEGSRTVYFGATALQGNGEKVPGTSFSPGPVKAGKTLVTVTIEKTENSEPYTSTRLKVCLQVAGGKNISCRTFDYTMEWQ